MKRYLVVVLLLVIALALQLPAGAVVIGPEVQNYSGSAGDNLNDGTFIAASHPSPIDGNLTAVNLWANTIQTFDLQIWHPLGNNQYQLMGQVAVTPVATGANTIAISGGDQLDVLTGDVMGFWYRTRDAGVALQPIPFSWGADVLYYTGYAANYPHTPYTVGDIADVSTWYGNTGRIYALNIEVTPASAPVPEPSSLLALCGGLTVLGGLARRRLK